MQPATDDKSPMPTVRKQEQELSTMDQEADYLLQPAGFHPMNEAQGPINTLERNPATQHPETTGILHVA